MNQRKVDALHGSCMQAGVWCWIEVCRSWGDRRLYNCIGASRKSVDEKSVVNVSLP